MGSLKVVCHVRSDAITTTFGGAGSRFPSQKRASDRKLQRPSLAQLPLFIRYTVTAFLKAKKIVSSDYTSRARMMEFELKNFSPDCCYVFFAGLLLRRIFGSLFSFAVDVIMVLMTFLFFGQKVF